MKKLAVIGLAAILAVSMSFTALAGTWKQDNAGWWYQDDNGSYPVSTWRQIDGAWYFFDNEGYDVRNQWIGNYYLGSTGEMLTKTITPDGYLVGADGAWITEGDSSSNYAQIKKEIEAPYDAKTENIMTFMQAWNEKNIKAEYKFTGMYEQFNVVDTWKSDSIFAADNCCVVKIDGFDMADMQNFKLSMLWEERSVDHLRTTIKVIGDGPGYLPEDTVTGYYYAMVYMNQKGDVLGVAFCNSGDVVLSVAGSVAGRTLEPWTNSELRYKKMVPITGEIY